jgi:hypothetical protein
MTVIIDVPHVVGIRQAQILVESVLQGEELLEMSQMPFAERARGISQLLEHLGYGLLVGVDADLGKGTQRPEDGDPLRMGPR